MNASIYVYERGYLLRQDLTHRTNSIVVMKDTAVLDIDSEEDFIMMELIAGHLREHDPEFAKIVRQLGKIAAG